MCCAVCVPKTDVQCLTSNMKYIETLNKNIAVATHVLVRMKRCRMSCLMWLFTFTLVGKLFSSAVCEVLLFGFHEHFPPSCSSTLAKP